MMVRDGISYTRIETNDLIEQIVIRTTTKKLTIRNVAYIAHQIKYTKRKT